MQTLAAKGSHIAAWGPYQIRIGRPNQSTPWTIKIIDVRKPATSNVVTMYDRTSYEDGIRDAALYLKDHGCYAMVDGQRRDVSDFLVFVPAGVVFG